LVCDPMVAGDKDSREGGYCGIYVCFPRRWLVIRFSGFSYVLVKGVRRGSSGFSVPCRSVWGGFLV